MGDPTADHNCWENPERMDTPRTLYRIDTSTHGTEIAAETAAALAASSVVFAAIDKPYSILLLQRGYKIMRILKSLILYYWFRTAIADLRDIEIF